MSASNKSKPSGEAAGLDAREQARRVFAEEFGVIWERERGSPRMEGRVIGYLMVMRDPYISLADLGKVLKASTGSISLTTRNLADMGFIRRHVVPGDRSHYFRAESDMWGSWLAGERRYLDRQRVCIESALAIVEDSSDEGDIAARERLENGRDYMIWLASYHQKMLAAWETYKQERDERVRLDKRRDH